MNYYQKKGRLDALFKLPCPFLQSVVQKDKDFIVSSTVPVKRPDWGVMGFSRHPLTSVRAERDEAQMLLIERSLPLFVFLDYFLSTLNRV